MDMELWTYNEDLKDITDLDGFDVAALDGDIGEVDDATYDEAGLYLRDPAMTFYGIARVAVTGRRL